MLQSSVPDAFCICCLVFRDDLLISDLDLGFDFVSLVEGSLQPAAISDDSFVDDFSQPMDGLPILDFPLLLALT